MKSGILNFTVAAKVAPAEVILLYLVAAADPDDAVARRGEELLKKRYLFELVLNMASWLFPCKRCTIESLWMVIQRWLCCFTH
jgi:hypothetical protein